MTKQPAFSVHNLSDKHNMNLDLDLELVNECAIIAKNFWFKSVDNIS